MNPQNSKYRHQAPEMHLPPMLFGVNMLGSHTWKSGKNAGEAALDAPETALTLGERKTDTADRNFAHDKL